MTSVQIEIERKYDVDGDAEIPDFSGIAGVVRGEAQDAVLLEAVYFDTARNDLASNRITLRRRTGGKDAGWHLKLPADTGRTEVHAPLGRKTTAESRVPKALLDIVRVHVRDRMLSPVARISTTRTAWLLMDRHDRALAEVVDDAVSATDVREGTRRLWREWEAELIPAEAASAAVPADAGFGSGDDATAGTHLLDAIEERLVHAGARPPASLSKLAHALGRDALGTVDEAALPAVPARFDCTHFAGPVAVAAIRFLVHALKAADPAVRRNEDDSVHRMRTIVRRLRSVLASFGNIFDREASDGLRDRLQRLGSALGDARDLEVRADRADAELDALPERLRDEHARRRLVGDTWDDHRVAAAAVRRMLSSDRYYRLLDDLDAFVTDPPFGSRATEPADAEFARLVAKEVKRTRKRVRAVAGDLTDRDAGAGEGDGAAPDRMARLLHDARKAARRLRYTVEAVNGKGSEPLGSRAKRLAGAAKRAQDTLGEHRDSALFAEHLLFESERAHDAGEKSFVYGVLHGRSEANARAALAESEAALRALKKRSRRWTERH